MKAVVNQCLEFGFGRMVFAATPNLYPLTPQCQSADAICQGGQNEAGAERGCCLTLRVGDGITEIAHP